MPKYRSSFVSSNPANDIAVFNQEQALVAVPIKTDSYITIPLVDPFYPVFISASAVVGNPVFAELIYHLFANGIDLPVSIQCEPTESY